MNYSFLANTLLFKGVSAEELKSMLQCLDGTEKEYSKSEIVFFAGESIDSIGLVLSGSVNIEYDDIWGNKTILGRAEVGQIFGEAYACRPSEPLMINAVASEKCTILFLKISRLTTTCQNSCTCHNRLIQNLLNILSLKNLNLSRRSLHITSKSIRGRLLSYLSEQAKERGSASFSIPYNRQQLADYLGVDRSALSNELSKMQQEGLISYDRNSFTIIMT